MSLAETTEWHRDRDSGRLSRTVYRPGGVVDVLRVKTILWTGSEQVRFQWTAERFDRRGAATPRYVSGWGDSEAAAAEAADRALPDPAAAGSGPAGAG